MIPSRSSNSTRLMVMADALFDTRLGALAMIDPAHAKSMINNMVKYRTRVSDEWHLIDPNIPTKLYEQVYKNRDLNVLKNSIMSRMFCELMQIIEGIEERGAMGDPRCKNISLHINFYPYKLSDEQLDYFLGMIALHIGLTTTIKAVYIPLKEMRTSRFRLEGYTHVIMYDLQEWMQAAYGDSKSPDAMGQTPEIQVIACAKVNQIQEVLTEMQNPIEGLPESYLEIFQRMMAIYFNLKWLTAETFSIVDLQLVYDVRKAVYDRRQLTPDEVLATNTKNFIAPDEDLPDEQSDVTTMPSRE